VNSHNSISTQKTSRSGSSEVTFYRKVASVQQINELYTALNELIHPSPVKGSNSADNCSIKKQSQWSSEENLLDKRRQLYPRANSETTYLRTARSASCLSSKSCYAAIGSKKVPVTAPSRSAETPKSGGICWKLVAKFRGKKSGDQWKLTEQKLVKGGGQIKAANGENNVHSIDDLLEMTKLHASTNGKSNSKDKRNKTKGSGRAKANSFDSSEAGMPNICADKVSSKLRTWYTRAASYAATIEDEEKSRTESICTGSNENALEETDCDSKGEKTDEGIMIKDFDASTANALDKKSEDLSRENEERTTCLVKKLERRACNDLKSKNSTIFLESSCSKSELNDDPFDDDEVTASKILSQTLQKSEHRCNLIRRLSLSIVEDVLAGKSTSSVPISSLNRDLSKRKVQLWLKDLHANDDGKDSIKCKNCAEGVLPSNNRIDIAVVSEKSDPSSKVPTLDKELTENVEESDGLSKECSLLGKALFYIPNMGKPEQTSVNMILNF